MSSEKREVSPEASPLKGPAPKAIPEDTSDVVFEDGIPLSPMAGDQSVQFISGTPANGDAKVEIGDSGVPPTFVGLGKEELMKYANDPFWVRLRWLLFILFWVLWIGMLVGAVVIIVLAPRCAEKKIVAETYYQLKASDLIKDSKIDENTDALKDLGIQNIIISEALQHDIGNPEAVTNFENFQVDNVDLLDKAIENLRTHGIKILLQIVPNHSGTSHEWFNNNSTNDWYVREPFEKVRTSPWVMQDNSTNAWTPDTRPGFEDSAYLQQFSGKVADLNFKNDAVVDEFKRVLKGWTQKKIDGFAIGKASFLVENLTDLMARKGQINQPENIVVVSRIVGISAKGPNLVELNDASNDTINQYTAKGFVPLIKSIDTSSVDKIRDGLESLISNPHAVINLSKQSKSPDKDRLLNLFASAAGSHSLISHDASKDSTDFIKKLLAFQKANPRGKSSTVNFTTTSNIVAALRSDSDDEHLIIANVGPGPESFSPISSGLTQIVKGDVVLVTPNAQQKIGDKMQDTISISPQSGVVIKLEKQPVES